MEWEINDTETRDFQVAKSVFFKWKIPLSITEYGKQNALVVWWEYKLVHFWREIIYIKALTKSIVSSSQWAWVWTNSRIQWRTRKPGVLQSMASQIVGHDWAAEQQEFLPHGSCASSLAGLGAEVLGAVLTCEGGALGWGISFCFSEGPRWATSLGHLQQQHLC